MSVLLGKIQGCLTGGLIGDAMGAPVENMDYPDIEAKYGELCDFEGEGTDDSVIKLILCKAILDNDGHVTADEFAAAMLASRDKYNYFYIPVRNAFHKADSGVCLPVNCGQGNMPSSSTSMSISPMGILNAGNPRQAALETYDIAGFIHSGVGSGFCRDAACAMAAAVAEALSPDATVDSVLTAATAYLHKQSAAEMTGYINRAIELAREAGSYKAFREVYYKENRQVIPCDSRETVSCAFALFALAKGDPNAAIVYGANYGRDADTIATMVGALSGAFMGLDAIKPEWRAKLDAAGCNQGELAAKLLDVASAKMSEAKAVIEKAMALC